MSWKNILLEGDAAVLSDTVPGTIGVSDTPNAGVAVEASRQDHVHGSPATYPPTSHDLDTHNSVTVAELSAIVSDATLDDSSATRTPSSHAPAHKDSGGDELLLHELGQPTGSVDFNKQQLVNPVFEQQTTPPATPTQGQVYYDTDDDHIYVYVAA